MVKSGPQPYPQSLFSVRPVSMSVLVCGWLIDSCFKMIFEGSYSMDNANIQTGNDWETIRLI